LSFLSGAIEVSVVLDCCVFSLGDMHDVSGLPHHPEMSGTPPCIVANTVPSKNRELDLSKPALGRYQTSYLVGNGAFFFL
jgi:hypothetical protein